MELFYCFFNQEQGASDHAVSNSLAHLYSCNTLRTKVNNGLAQDAEMIEYRVVEQGEDHQCQDQGEPEPETDLLNAQAERASTNGFDQIVQQMPAVEHGNRQKIENADI
jgi:hypothetical protein